MTKIMLKVENISKQYRLGMVGTGTLSHDLNRWWTRIRGKEDPYLKIGESNDRSTVGESNYVWALKDINFEVIQGEVLGIIGKNGAGKSTLLKILSRVTSPTTGEIKSRGRIASLLEVGTGFHPELTGRENIFLNGAILGMSKKEVTSKIDEIISFSGCERYVDTPVKRYSSGMRVRLAFAVAAHLEPDILVIDEVLAVGDAEFQKKAIGKMQDISKTDGRTVLFVSHNMAAVESLCTRCILLSNGTIKETGITSDVIKTYINDNNEVLSNTGTTIFENTNKNTYIDKVNLYNPEMEIKGYFFMGDSIAVEIFVKNKSELNNIKASVIVEKRNGARIIAVRSHEILTNQLKCKSDFSLFVTIADLNLMPDQYLLTFAIANNNETIQIIENKVSFVIEEKDIYKSGKIPKGGFLIFNQAKWELKQQHTHIGENSENL